MAKMHNMAVMLWVACASLVGLIDAAKAGGPSTLTDVIADEWDAAAAIIAAEAQVSALQAEDKAAQDAFLRAENEVKKAKDALAAREEALHNAEIAFVHAQTDNSSGSTASIRLDSINLSDLSSMSPEQKAAAENLVKAQQAVKAAQETVAARSQLSSQLENQAVQAHAQLVNAQAALAAINVPIKNASGRK